MMNPTKEKYLKIATEHTEEELAQILDVHPRTIRRYAKEFNMRPKPTYYQNRSLEEYRSEFDALYRGTITLGPNLLRDKSGYVRRTCICQRCHTQWDASITAKLNQKTGCIKCDKGQHGNRYDVATVESMMNANYQGQWKLIKYGHYSKKDSTIRCTLCGHEQTVKLADFIKTTTMRCTNCQTGSFGEYVIANTLRYNNIPFEREKRITICNRKYRLDFVINETIGLEYSGLQHFQPGLYYNEDINRGVELKKEWCQTHGLRFVELAASYNVSKIVDDLSNILAQHLEIPTPEFFRANSPDMSVVLEYMRTHSMRQTIQDLHIPDTKIKRYVRLAGYSSVSAWQADNKR